MEEHTERSRFRHKEWNTWAEDLMERLMEAPFLPAPAQRVPPDRQEVNATIQSSKRPRKSEEDRS